MEHYTFTSGDPAPWFRIASALNPSYNFSMTAGKISVICFLESLSHPESLAILREFAARRRIFDNENSMVLIVSVDPRDAESEIAKPFLKRMIFLWDSDRKMSEQFGVIDPSDGTYRRQTMLFDRRLRFLTTVPIVSDLHAGKIAKMVHSMPLPSTVAGHAPVLMIPRVFEPEFCRSLIEYYHRVGSLESGVMQQVGDQTVPVLDPSYKSRRDCKVTDEVLCEAIRNRLYRRVAPEIQRSFQFQCTHLERYIVACYDASEEGKFNQHRDNTTMGTAHRKFAVTINLNAEEYEGGDLRFREFGMKTYRASTGGAIVFSCSLLHEALPVTKGRRFAFLPFLFDDASAKMRDSSRSSIAPEVQRRSLKDRSDSKLE